jgi:hypothetical protein
MGARDSDSAATKISQNTCTACRSWIAEHDLGKLSYFAVVETARDEAIIVRPRHISHGKST